MPITPFHGGIGLALKGPLASRFSFTIFTATQVAIDLESAYFLVARQYPVHRFCHTFIGASLVCLAVATLGRPLCKAIVHGCVRSLGRARPRWWEPDTEISRTTALTSALAGMVGHVVPDAIMHADARPLAPFSDANPLLGLISLGELHLGLLALGAMGFGWLVAVAVRSSKRGMFPRSGTGA